MTVVGSMQDAITGYNVTAAGRIAELALMSAGLIVGVVVALYAATQIEPTVFSRIVGEHNLLQDLGGAKIGSQVVHLPVQTLAGASTSACFALASYAPPRPLLAAGIGGALAAAVHSVLTSVGLQSVLAGALATTAVGLVGGIGQLRHDPVDDAGRLEVARADPLLCSQLGSTVRGPVQDGRGPLGG